MYPRGSVAKLMERYEGERKLPGNEEDNFEEIEQLGGPRFAFVETDGLSFLVQHTPKQLGPSWSECLSIEYRPIWGGISMRRPRPPRWPATWEPLPRPHRRVRDGSLRLHTTRADAISGSGGRQRRKDRSAPA